MFIGAVSISAAVHESGAYSHFRSAAAAAATAAAAAAHGGVTGSGAGQGPAVGASGQCAPSQGSDGGAPSSGAGPSSNGDQTHVMGAAQGQEQEQEQVQGLPAGATHDPHVNGGFDPGPDKEEQEAKLEVGPACGGVEKDESGMELTPEPSGSKDGCGDGVGTPSGDAVEEGDGDGAEEDGGEEQEPRPYYNAGRRRGRYRRLAGANGAGGGAAAAAAKVDPLANLPPAPPPPDPAEAGAINDWIDREVLCTAIAKVGNWGRRSPLTFISEPARATTSCTTWTGSWWSHASTSSGHSHLTQLTHAHGAAGAEPCCTC